MTARAAHLLALCAFALAQPLYDLLGRNPEFFAARGASGAEVVAFALALLVVPPAVLVGVELAAGLLDRRLAAALHLVFVAGLVSLIVLQPARRLDAPDLVVIAVAVLAGAAAAVVYARIRAARTLITLLAAAPALFLALFLLASPAGDLVLGNEARAQVATVAAGRAPAVVLVLDELPLNSVLDRVGRVDPVRFPHLAALARRADWFPNTTSVHEGTAWAVPAILTGRFPRPRELPRFEDHRRNLFTLLGRRYRVEATEGGTSLCPTTVCRDAHRSFAGQLESLAEDSSVVYLHIVAPQGLARDLPSVTERWAGFLGGARDEAAHFDRFLGSIRPDREPALFYGHVLLPHSPWRYLPDGRTYDLRLREPLWGADEVWSDDEGLVVQSWQRHLLQTAYVDALVGRLVARLRASGLFERALVVVVADHGISFRPGGKRRPVWPSNVEDIAFVPLLVKRPGQRAGRVLERHVRTVDVLPTIADVLGVSVPWRLDGRSAYGPTRSSAVVAVLKDAGEAVSLPLGEAIARRRAALRRQLALFGSGTTARALFGVGRYRGVLGLEIHAGRPLDGAELDVNERAGPLLEVAGRVPPAVHDVALAAEGRVVAVAPVYGGRFWALAPAASASVLAVEGRPSAPRFRPLVPTAS